MRQWRRRLRLAGIRKNPKPPNSSQPRSFAEIDATRERLPSSAVELTREERKLLKDPDWIDEDEADTILALRDLKRDKRQAIPFRDYLKKRGITLVDR